MISIQNQDFSIADEYAALRHRAGDAGAIVTFTGLVREVYDVPAEGSESAAVSSLFLEHYPGMTEKCLQEIQQQAEAKWPLLATRIIHRVGELHGKDQIVLVATASAHRLAAFEAAEFIMDYLKSKAPFWKQQKTATSSVWVESRDSDKAAIERWQDS
ncbi:MAG: molybdopterin synthase catalytic subunit MoaE [Gammaproteobacteria bacterium]|jgi:molybdopterin synthase catalytic subunit|nr:molybdopterin synthase catalytic subunit MoaE [Gammaproteobacteria bacterium]MDG2337271.1 molybdopterin synthase catalytic subunit MoaE [Gammaproteobacteria bacterium]